VSKAGGGCNIWLDGRDNVSFGKYRSVSTESRMEANKGTKCCYFSGSFGREIDDISIGYVAKFQVWRWTVESRSSDYGTTLVHECVYARKTNNGRVEGSRKLKRNHIR